MRIVRVETLVECGDYAHSAEWRETRKAVHESVRKVDWPRGSGKFTIYPESGKKRGEGNGVKPIKTDCMLGLKQQGWVLEEPLNILNQARPGKLDAVFYTSYGPLAVEWETGNISSSHRAMNKMALGLLKGVLAGGILIVPSRKLYPYLTDRIGNVTELEPYFDLWSSIPCEHGILEITVIEQDATSTAVPRIPKTTAGRALG